MKDAFERIIEELRIPVENKDQQDNGKGNKQEEDDQGKWDYYIETD